MKELNNLLDSYTTDYPIGAISVGVTSREKLLYTYSKGYLRYGENSKKVDKNTLFRIASISKIVTGIALYKLVDEGLIDVDKNVSEYIPWIDRTNGNMTVKKLLSHTAGLPSEYTPDGVRDESLLEKSLMDELSKVDFGAIREESEYLYSNLGIRLASLIMEKVTGERFTSLAQKLVLEPLEMQDTTYFLDEAVQKDLCYPCDILDGKLALHEKTWENAVRYSAGGLFSNINDLSRLARFILNEKSDKGEKIISDKSFSIIKSKIAKDEKGDGDYYGQTMMSKERGNITFVGHLGSAPPYATALFTAKDSGVILLMNTYHSALRLEIVQKVFDLIYKN
ncbi:MAG: beta-lactamase family protein [Clostridia bacterium]|nr:beta-lactamase family protein [Clostridia bacterium]